MLSYENLGHVRNGRARKTRRRRQRRRRSIASCLRPDAIVAAAFCCIEWLPFLSLAAFDLSALVAAVWLCPRVGDRGLDDARSVHETASTFLLGFDNASLVASTSPSRPRGRADRSRGDGSATSTTADTLLFLRVCLGGISLARTLYRAFRSWQFVVDLRTAALAERLLIARTREKRPPSPAAAPTPLSSSSCLPLSFESAEVVESVAVFKRSSSLDADKERRLASALARFGIGEVDGINVAGAGVADGRRCEGRVDRSGLAFAIFECLSILLLAASAILHSKATRTADSPSPCRSLVAVSAISIATAALRYAACIVSFCDSQRRH